MRVLSIVGARPEFIQAWPVSCALDGRHEEVLVHTGQHYDYLMSQSFFDQLGIPEPSYNLEVGSGSHGQQTAHMLLGLESVMLKEKPDLVVVRGDTNSTLAGALAASKLNLPLVHIEAGERSFRRDMPEEINRIVTDRLAGLHLCASRTALSRLRSEGIEGSAYWVGDVMLDARRKIAATDLPATNVLGQFGLRPGEYSLVTVHRSANTDIDERLVEIVECLNRVEETVFFPAHPRTQDALARVKATFDSHVVVTDPVGYLEIAALVQGARIVATDSGGLQREAYFARIPCLTLRDETEWTETVRTGWNRLVGTNPETVLAAWHGVTAPTLHPPIFGDGHAAERIASVIGVWAQAGYSTPLPEVPIDELAELERVEARL
jgi:UDP-GlcNAc3NAcA epimerase